MGIELMGSDTIHDGERLDWQGSTMHHQQDMPAMFILRGATFFLGALSGWRFGEESDTFDLCISWWPERNCIGLRNTGFWSILRLRL